MSILATLCAAALQTSSPLDELDPSLRDALPDMTQCMVDGLTRQTPNSSRWYTEAEGSLFVGSYDVHSNVIAHWSLLTLARLEGDKDLAKRVCERLAPEALDEERQLFQRVAHDRRITYPYDVAWLLMLLSELSKHVDDDTDAYEFRDELETGVLEWLETSDFPEQVPGRNGVVYPYCGFYRSWLWTYALVLWSEPITDGAEERLEALYTERIQPERDGILATKTSHPFDFLWPPALLALIERTRGEEPPCLYPLEEFPPLPETVSLRDVHVVGLELSRTWPYAVDGRRGLPGAETAYLKRTQDLLARPDLWRDDFTVVSHWVPQFIWIGMWLRMGRP